MKRFNRAALVGVGALVAISGLAPLGASDCTGTTTGATPISDLGPRTYQGYQGGLYPLGTNVRPALHELLGQTLAARVVPRDEQGVEDPRGKILFVSVGMSNTKLEFNAFLPIAQADPLRDPHVVVLNGARGGYDANRMSDPASTYWTKLDSLVKNAGAAPQVQVAWLKQANGGPSGTFPDDAQLLRENLGEILSILRDRFPNLLLVYLSSRVYAGYATTILNPEPYAYESGFAVKWFIEGQITGAAFPVLDPTGNVNNPWLSWGPYMWADGLVPRSDGLTWTCPDFIEDGTHPSDQGSLKVATMLLQWVHSDPTAKVWYEGTQIVRYPGLASAA